MSRLSRIGVWRSVAVLLVLTAALAAGCSCGKRNQARGPEGFGPGAGNLAAAAANLDPEMKKQCAASCKTLCERANQCNVPNFNKPALCGKACWFLCAKGVLDEEMRGCIKPDTDCPGVTQCLTKLGDKVRAARDAMKKGQGLGAPGPAAAPPAPPAANAEAPQ
jgi:hypothetical protein